MYNNIINIQNQHINTYSSIKSPNIKNNEMHVISKHVNNVKHNIKNKHITIIYKQLKPIHKSCDSIKS